MTSDQGNPLDPARHMVMPMEFHEAAWPKVAVDPEPAPHDPAPPTATEEGKA